MICSPGMLEIGAGDVPGKIQGCEWGEVTPGHLCQHTPNVSDHNMLSSQSRVPNFPQLPFAVV